MAAASAGNVHTISNSYVMGAYQVMNIGAGTTTKLNGVVSGNYGLIKEGTGTLELNNNNTFTGTNSGLRVFEGTVRIAGTNTYSGTTSVTFGSLILATNATTASRGLGTDATSVALGADGTQFTGSDPAAFYVEGDYTMARNIALSTGSFVKRVGAMNTTTGALYTGGIAFGTSTNVTLEAVNATDRAVFSGQFAFSAAANTVVTIGGQGTVEYSGSAKNYNGDTNIQNGATLKLASGFNWAAPSKVTVNAGGEMKVNGTMGGTGTLVITGGLLSGTGTVSRAVTIDAADIIGPGDGGVGTLSLSSGAVLGGGGIYQWDLTDADSTPGSAGIASQLLARLISRLAVPTASSSTLIPSPLAEHPDWRATSMV